MIEAIVSAPLEPLVPVSKGFRLLGVTLSSLAAETGIEHPGDPLCAPSLALTRSARPGRRETIQKPQE